VYSDGLQTPGVWLKNACEGRLRACDQAWAALGLAHSKCQAVHLRFEVLDGWLGSDSEASVVLATAIQAGDGPCTRPMALVKYAEARPARVRRKRVRTGLCRGLVCCWECAGVLPRTPLSMLACGRAAQRMRARPLAHVHVQVTHVGGQPGGRTITARTPRKRRTSLGKGPTTECMRMPTHTS
jgi:hypothetical protein